jgi:hypothetical protein
MNVFPGGPDNLLSGCRRHKRLWQSIFQWHGVFHSLAGAQKPLVAARPGQIVRATMLPVTSCAFSWLFKYIERTVSPAGQQNIPRASIMELWLAKRMAAKRHKRYVPKLQ